MKRLTRHLSYANITSTIALVLATGTGVVYAAAEIGAREIENNSVRTQELKNGKGVTGKDVRRDSLGGREVDESELVGSRIIEIDGVESPSCDPVSAGFIDCAALSLELGKESDLLIDVTGGFAATQDNASSQCEIRVDDIGTAGSALPGVTTNNTSTSATDGFARTAVREDVPPGPHTIALACQQLGAADAQIRTPTISVIAVSSR